MSFLQRRTPIVALMLAVLSGWSATIIAQTKVGYVATSVIRERFDEAQQANQRILTMTDEWKKDLENRQNEIQELQEEITKKRLIWSDEERSKKEEILTRKRKEYEDFSRQKFGPDGDFDKLVRDTFKPIEEKIAVAIEEVARSESYDVIWDKSTQPLVYVNPRYDVTIKVMERLNIPVDDLRELYEEIIKEAPEEKRKKPRRRVKRRPSDRKKEQQDEEEEPEPELESGTPDIPK